MNFYQRILPLFSAGFFVIAGYEFIRSPSVTLFQEHYGPQYTPFMMTFLPLLNFMVFYLYGKTLTRFGAKRTVFWSTLVSAVAIFGTIGLIQSGFDLARGFLFLFREVYIVLLIEQFWSLMDSIIEEEESKKLNYFFTAFTSVGAVLAGLAVGQYATKLGTLSLPLITAALLVPSAFLTNIAYSNNHVKLRHEMVVHPSPENETANATLGLSFFKRYPVLGYLLGMVLVSQLLSTILGLMFQEKLHVFFAGRNDEQTAYAGNFYAALNAVSIFFQLVVGPFLLSRFKPGFVFILVPVLNLLATLFAIGTGGMLPISFAFLMFKAMDYSIFRATKETLFIRYPFDVRYRTKGIIDVVGYRLSKGLGSAGFAFIEMMGHLSMQVYGLSAVVCTFLWAGMLPGFAKSFKKERGSHAIEA